MGDLPPRKLRPCSWCGLAAYTRYDTCKPCTGLETRAGRPSTYADGLRDGRWVNQGLVQVWEVAG